MLLVKKYSYLVLVALFSTFVVACDDDDEVVDAVGPTVNITSPTDDDVSAGFMAGSSFTITGTVTDDNMLDEIRIQLMDAGNNMIYQREIDDINQASYTLNETIDIPIDADLGQATLTLLAQDKQRNETTRTWTFDIQQAGNATFNVTVPESTPQDAQIFVVGSMTPNGWDSDDSDEAWMLTRNDDGTYTGNFMLPEGTQSEFKFRIKSDDPNNPWKFVEKGADCSEIANRTATGTAGMQSFDVSVENWANLGPCI